VQHHPRTSTRPRTAPARPRPHLHRPHCHLRPHSHPHSHSRPHPHTRTRTRTRPTHTLALAHAPGVAPTPARSHLHARTGTCSPTLALVSRFVGKDSPSHTSSTSGATPKTRVVPGSCRVTRSRLTRSSLSLARPPRRFSSTRSWTGSRWTGSGCRSKASDSSCHRMLAKVMTTALERNPSRTRKSVNMSYILKREEASV